MNMLNQVAMFTLGVGFGFVVGAALGVWPKHEVIVDAPPPIVFGGSHEASDAQHRWVRGKKKRKRDEEVIVLSMF